MLKTLKIQNFAIIKEALLNFEGGFNVLTGETGAGKSMVVDAISLLLGGKPKVDDIRTGEEEATVEGLFSVKDNSSIRSILIETGFKRVEDELIVKRVIQRNGKNKIFINNSIASQNVLYEIGKHLVDICAQNENRFLMNPEHHIDVLDNYASLQKKVKEFAGHFDRLSKVLEKKRILNERKTQALEKADFLKFVLKEVEELKLKESEEEELKGLKKKLQNLEKIRDLAVRSYESLYSQEGSIAEKLKNVSKSLDSLKGMDSTLGDSSLNLDGVDDKISDMSFELKKYVDGLDFDAGKLEEVEDRLDKISKITRKYGSVSQAIERANNAKDELSALENFDDLVKELENEEKNICEVIERSAFELNEERKKKSKTMDSEIAGELKLLSMDGAKFVTKIKDVGSDPRKRDAIVLPSMTVCRKGKDEIEFYLSTNTGEDPKPLENVASLGELSRIMLALKVVFYGKNKLMGSFVFDEIDTGIGGKVAELVGRNLQRLSKGKQVICVTHLSQIASYADHHFFIKKNVVKERTYFDVKRLDGEERKEEIARMIGGLIVTQKTRALAEELLKSSKEANT